MANQERGEFEVVLGGGKKRKLFFGHNEIAELEGALGYPWQEFVKNIQGIRQGRALVWAALLRHNPGISLETVGDWLGTLFHEEPEQYAEVIGQAAKAFNAHFPVAQKSEESEEQDADSKNAPRPIAQNGGNGSAKPLSVSA